ncbi:MULTISPECIES: hypothetical protein [unclassified Rhizobium]|uniref:hypothetical protein n=1 Tax=unclassified Rhizobium TaxID=2613769 RepID=UPI001ADAF076|nr:MULTISPECIES: hypothetical protein [unclassified Rhizobium]MBO9125481.1 hypothetical protein [Rhizobium sp. 16-488-2b]MBO9176066.1 hypothetical protein [Rhizobium sp. 16-488-2a]
MAADIDPPIGRDGAALVRKVALHLRQNSRSYPLALSCDARGAERAVSAGYLKRVDGDRHLVVITRKGEAYLDRLMRAE